MGFDWARLDPLVAEMTEGPHSACFLEGFIARYAKNLKSLEEVQGAAAYIGDSKALARNLQICFMGGLKYSKGKEEWATTALQEMDQLVFLLEESTGHTVLEVMMGDIPPQSEKDFGEDSQGC